MYSDKTRFRQLARVFGLSKYLINGSNKKFLIVK
jgi:hypothetical protein